MTGDYGRCISGAVSKYGKIGKIEYLGNTGKGRVVGSLTDMSGNPFGYVVVVSSLQLLCSIQYELWIHWRRQNGSVIKKKVNSNIQKVVCIKIRAAFFVGIS